MTNATLATPHDHAPLTGRVLWSRRIYLVIVWIFAICVAIQAFLAGMGVFVSPVNWALHKNFVHLFELLPVLLFILALVGQMPGTFRWLPVLMFVMLAAQYATAQISKSAGMEILGAFHPVIAVLLFWISTVLIRRTQALFK
jgi:hypothetical protein